MWQREMFVPLLENDCYLSSLRTVTSPCVIGAKKLSGWWHSVTGHCA